MGVNPDIFWRPVKTCACFSWLPITAQPIMSINAAPSLNRHDPTNPHPVFVVSGWNPADECPELTRISLGLSGITQAGEGLSMIASLGWGAVGVFVCSPVCACTLAMVAMRQVVKYIHGSVCLHVPHVYKAAKNIRYDLISTSLTVGKEKGNCLQSNLPFVIWQSPAHRYIWY